VRDVTNGNELPSGCGYHPFNLLPTELNTPGNAATVIRRLGGSSGVFNQTSFGNAIWGKRFYPDRRWLFGWLVLAIDRWRPGVPAAASRRLHLASIEFSGGRARRHARKLGEHGPQGLGEGKAFRRPSLRQRNREILLTSDQRARRLRAAR
jgi:hypothetical protein